jgi:hypothetical protein
MQSLTYLLGFLGSSNEIITSSTSLVLVGLGSYYLVLLGIIQWKEKGCYKGPNPQAIGTLTTGQTTPTGGSTLAAKFPDMLASTSFSNLLLSLRQLRLREMSVNFLYRIHIYCLFSWFALADILFHLAKVYS